MIYDKVIDETIEVSSMGIRVDEKSLKEQIEIDGKVEKLSMPFHQKLLKCELPYSIGGGIGQSRILMLLLEKQHIAEVQASFWEKKVEEELREYQIL